MSWVVPMSFGRPERVVNDPGPQNAKGVRNSGLGVKKFGQVLLKVSGSAAGEKLGETNEQGGRRPVGMGSHGDGQFPNPPPQGISIT